MSAQLEDAAADLPGVLAIDHLGIAVADLDAAVALHTGVLGLRIAHREDNPEQGVREVMLAADSQPGQDGDVTQVQLLGALADDTAVGRFLRSHGPGLHHLAYRVADLAIASDVFTRRGYRLIYDLPRVGTHGSLINFVHPKDTGGILIELVQAPRSSDR